MNNKIVWYDGRKIKNEDTILTLVSNHSFEFLLVDYGMLQKIKPQKKMKIIVEVEKREEISKELSGKIILSRQLDILKHAKSEGFETAYLTNISSGEDMENAWIHGIEHNYLVLEFKDATNIPLELILARTQARTTAVIKKVATLEEAEICFGVMESGSDGVLLATEDMDEIIKVDKYMTKQKTTKLKLVGAKVTEVRHIGMGKRVCIDTVDILHKNEGMLVGSTSNGGILVSSETHYLPYMDLRPFRVNAGAIHSYVWGPDNMSPYLSDLKAGSKLLCVDTSGNAREVVVGRTKIETRPLLMIGANAEGKVLNLIIQDDWHIRIFGKDGEVRNGSDIKVGDELLAYVCEPGRHVGIKIDEELYEK
jgi:3-dehydroquinate synthase II/3-amino-4-hydroxybenzoic acid synthase